MQLRSLGTTDLKISPLGLGTWAIAGPNWLFGWGPQDDNESIDALERGLEGGVNWIDTAPVYGLGHAEDLLGGLLAKLPASKRPLIFSKCSVLFDENGAISHSLAPDALTADVEASLRRLRIETVDLCQIHWPAFPPGGPDEGIETAIATLADLQAAGKIRAIGVSNFTVDQLKRALAVAPIASVQPPLSLLMRAATEELLPFCQKNNIGVISYSTLQSGLLTGKMTRERIAALPENDWRKTMSAEFKEPNLSRNLDLVEVLRGIAQRRGQTTAIVAIAWVLSNQGVTGAIVGARNAKQSAELMPALDFSLNVEDLNEIAAALPEGYGAELAISAA